MTDDLIIPAEMAAGLRACARAPWSGAVPAIGFSKWVLALEQATQPGMLPMPAGFLLDPAEICTRIPLPEVLPYHTYLFGYHPRFGLLLGNAFGSTILVPVFPVPYPYRLNSPGLFGAPTHITKLWPQLFSRLLLLERGLGLRFALWLRLDAQHGQWNPKLGMDVLYDHWQPFNRFLNSAQNERWERLGKRLDVHADEKTYGSFTRVKKDSLIVMGFGSEALVLADDADDLEKALRFASEEGLLAQPNAFLLAPPAPRPAADCVRSVYEKRTPAPQTTSLWVERIDPPGEETRFLWNFCEPQGHTFSYSVPPNQVLATQNLLWPRASLRLRNFLGRNGCVRLPALASVTEVENWLRNEPAAAGWDILSRIEAEYGGTLLSSQWGLGSPERIGPFMMLRGRESLEPCGLAENEDEPPVPHELPWPFLRTHGVDLAIIGLLRERFDDALCTDRYGIIYYLNHEFGSLTAKAANLLGFLEKHAYWQERYGDGVGELNMPALVAACDIGIAGAEALGLKAVPEASDAVSSNHYVPRIWLFRNGERAGLPARTWLYTADVEMALRTAQWIIDHHPAVPIQVQIGVNAEHKRRQQIFEAANLPEVIYRSWWDWGQFPKSNSGEADDA